MNRLDELLLLWQDQALTPEHRAELKQLLAQPAARARVAEDFFLTGVVLESLRTQRAARTFLTPADQRNDLEGTVGRRRSGWPRLVRPAVAAAVLLALLGALLWFQWRPALPPVVPVSAEAYAQFEQVHGDTFVVNQQQKSPALAGQVLVAGQGIATEGSDSEAVLRMQDAVRLKLGGDTTVRTEDDEPGAGGPRVVLEQGDLLVEVNRSVKRRQMTVQTPLGVAVTQTEETALHISDAAGVAVVRGEVQFHHRETGRSIRLRGGQYLAVSADGELYAAELFAANGRVWATYPKAGLETTSLGYRVAFAPAGQRLAAVSRSAEGGLRIGPADGSDALGELPGERCLAFAPDGQVLATGQQSQVVLHDLAGGARPRVLTGTDRRARALCLAFAPDGRSLAVGKGRAKESGELEIWDVTTGALRTVWRGHAADIASLAFTPDGKYLASGGHDSTVVLWDVAAGQERSRIPVAPSQVVWSLAFAPDSQTLAIATGPEDFRLRQPSLVHLWDVATEQIRASLHGHTRAVTGLAFSADGQTLITGSADTTVRFWDLGSGREYGMLKGHKAAPGFEALAVALAPDGSYLATASLDRTVKVWKTTRVENEARFRVTVTALLDRTRPLW